MEREPVHQRPHATAAPVGGAHVKDELRGRMRLAGEHRLVAPTRRERAADHVDLRRDRLQLVVGLREQPDVRRRGGVRSHRGELRHPEPVQVGLVADDHVAHIRHERRDRGRVGGELGPSGMRQRRDRRAVRIDGDHQADPVQLGRVGRVPEALELHARDLPVSGPPDRGHPDRVEPGEACEAHFGVGAKRPLLRAVLRGADQDRAARSGLRGRGRERGEQDDGGEGRPHETKRKAVVE
jgi:hypothetical protein